MTAEDVKRLECNACPGPGGCGGMYTANTMATAIEVPRYEFPGSSSHPAESADKKEISKQQDVLLLRCWNSVLNHQIS